MVLLNYIVGETYQARIIKDRDGASNLLSAIEITDLSGAELTTEGRAEFKVALCTGCPLHDKGQGCGIQPPSQVISSTFDVDTIKNQGVCSKVVGYNLNNRPVDTRKEGEGSAWRPFDKNIIRMKKTLYFLGIVSTLSFIAGMGFASELSPINISIKHIGLLGAASIGVGSARAFGLVIYREMAILAIMAETAKSRKDSALDVANTLKVRNQLYLGAANIIAAAGLFNMLK